MTVSFLNSLVGEWEGTVRTWFRPDELADESTIRGSFEMLTGTIFKHEYHSEIQGKPRNGLELLAFNTVTNQFETSWVDSFHMNYGILTSRGVSSEQGFSVMGTYAVGEGEPDWGWKMVLDLKDPDRLLITSFNVTPSGEEAKAVEIIYARIG